MQIALEQNEDLKRKHKGLKDQLWEVVAGCEAGRMAGM
jgi:hypothetical protein